MLLQELCQFKMWHHIFCCFLVKQHTKASHFRKNTLLVSWATGKQVTFCCGQLVLFMMEEIQSQALSCWDFFNKVALMNTYWMLVPKICFNTKQQTSYPGSTVKAQELSPFSFFIAFFILLYCRSGQISSPEIFSARQDYTYYETSPLIVQTTTA